MSCAYSEMTRKPPWIFEKLYCPFCMCEMLYVYFPCTAMFCTDYCSILLIMYAHVLYLCGNTSCAPVVYLLTICKCFSCFLSVYVCDLCRDGVMLVDESPRSRHVTPWIIAPLCENEQSSTLMFFHQWHMSQCSCAHGVCLCSLCYIHMGISRMWSILEFH